HFERSGVVRRVEAELRLRVLNHQLEIIVRDASSERMFREKADLAHGGDVSGGTGRVETKPNTSVEKDEMIGEAQFAETIDERVEAQEVCGWIVSNRNILFRAGVKADFRIARKGKRRVRAAGDVHVRTGQTRRAEVERAGSGIDLEIEV